MAEEVNTPNSDGKSPNKDAGGSQGAGHVTDAGDVVAIICAVYCIIGAVWQLIDFKFLNNAQELIDSLDFIEDASSLVGYVLFMNVALWSAGAYFCWKAKNAEKMTAGARALIAIAVVAASRVCVWLVSQQFYAVLAGDSVARAIYEVLYDVANCIFIGAILLFPVLMLRKWWIGWKDE